MSIHRDHWWFYPSMGYQLPSNGRDGGSGHKSLHAMASLIGGRGIALIKLQGITVLGMGGYSAPARPSIDGYRTMRVRLPSLETAASASNLCNSTLTSSSSWFQYLFTIISTSSSVSGVIWWPVSWQHIIDSGQHIFIQGKWTARECSKF